MPDDRQLRILWVNDRASFYGGCERYVAATATGLRARGHTGRLLYDASHPTDDAFLRVFADGATSMAKAEVQLREYSPDLIYLHKVNDRQCVERLLDAAACPVIMFIHDHDHFCLRYHKITTLTKQVCRRPATAWNCYRCLGFINRIHEWPGVKFRRMNTLRTLQAMIRRCDHVVVGSNYMRQHVVAHDFEPGRVHRIPLFADCEPAPSKESAAKEKEDQFVFVGNFLPGKGIDLLLRAFARADTAMKLCIIGSIGDATPYEDQAKQLGLGERVIFHRKMARNDVLREIRESRAVIVPSRNPETFGLVAVEAISQRTPVIGSDAGATAEWIEDDVNGYQFPSDDVGALAACIERMAASPEKARNLGEQGFQLYEQSFQPERHMKKLERLFIDTIAVPANHPSSPVPAHA